MSDEQRSDLHDAKGSAVCEHSDVRQVCPFCAWDTVDPDTQVCSNCKEAIVPSFICYDCERVLPVAPAVARRAESWIASWREHFASANEYRNDRDRLLEMIDFISDACKEAMVGREE